MGSESINCGLRASGDCVAMTHEAAPPGNGLLRWCGENQSRIEPDLLRWLEADAESKVSEQSHPVNPGDRWHRPSVVGPDTICAPGCLGIWSPSDPDQIADLKGLVHQRMMPAGLTVRRSWAPTVARFDHATVHTFDIWTRDASRTEGH